MSEEQNSKVEIEKSDVEAASIKHFRNNNDIETFYRFIHDNGLRREASILMELVVKNMRKAARKKKGKVLN